MLGNGSQIGGRDTTCALHVLEGGNQARLPGDCGAIVPKIMRSKQPQSKIEIFAAITPGGEGLVEAAH